MTSALGNRALRERGGPEPITSSRTGHRWDALSHAYEMLGFEQAAGGDEAFRQLVPVSIIEPV